ncbi:MAG: hypothetical protein CME55_04615 [Halieaceae bacterium]|nr:hypothetical protein [Halieaceae bacterium]|tara:strand:+ start:1081 stop:1302 length:222 start_codon:yes stop_codon:yes gene_type:complete
MPLSRKSEFFCGRILAVLEHHQGQWMTSKQVAESLPDETVYAWNSSTVAMLLGIMGRKGQIEVQTTSPKKYRV